MRVDEDRERTALYKCYDKNAVIIYIGISHNPYSRLKMHDFHKGCWIQSCVQVDIQWFRTRKRAEEAEYAAIQKFKPKNNTALKKKPNPLAKTQPKRNRGGPIIRLYEGWIREPPKPPKPKQALPPYDPSKWPAQ